LGGGTEITICRISDIFLKTVRGIADKAYENCLFMGVVLFGEEKLPM
jgi:hypothetical protein